MKGFKVEEVIDFYYKVKGNLLKLHELTCKKYEISCDVLNPRCLYTKVLRAIAKGNMLQGKKKSDFMASTFVMPYSVKFNKDRTVSLEMKNNDLLYESFKQKKYIKKLQNERDYLQGRIKNENLAKLNKKIKRQTDTIKQQQSVIITMKKCMKLKEVKHISKASQCDTVTNEIKELNLILENLNAEFEEQNIQEETSNIFKTRDEGCGKPYNHKLREVCYNLISLNVGVNNIEKVIKTVLSLNDTEILDFPCEKTVRNMQSEISILTKHQINEFITENENITCHRDATTKKGRHFYGVNLSSNSTTVVAGLREVHDGKANTYLETLNEISDDIMTLTKSDSNFIVKTKNTMTDRCQTEKKVNSLISVQTNNTINTFHCSVHPILQFQEVCEKEISKSEQQNKISKDVTAVNLIKCVSKLFYKDGSGDPMLAANYIKSKGFSNIPIDNFRGNRFNTLFKNCAGTFFIKKYIIEYLSDSKSSVNFVQNVILQGLKNEHTISVIRAMGIMYFIITKQYMDITMNTNYNALNMAGLYRRLVDILETGISSPDDFIHGRVSLLHGPKQASQDKIEMSLFEVSELNSLTKDILCKLCQAIHDKCKKTFSDFFENGKYACPSQNLLEEAEHCPQNNISVERLMGKLDSGLHNAPNILNSNLESRIMFKNNETDIWLKERPDEEKRMIINDAVKKRKTCQETTKQRNDDLFQKTLNTIEDRKKRKADTENKKMEKNRLLSENIEKMGIPTNEDEIEEKIINMKTKKEKILYLKTQINFFKENVVLKDKSLTAFSKSGKPLDIPSLKANLNKIINKRNLQQMIEPEKTVGRSIYHTWKENDGNEKEYAGKILSYSNGMFEINYFGSGVFSLWIDDICEDMQQDEEDIICVCPIENNDDQIV